MPHRRSAFEKRYLPRLTSVKAFQITSNSAAVVTFTYEPVTPLPMNSKNLHYKAQVDSTSVGVRIDIFLARRFAQELDLSRRKLRALIETGSVTVNGSPTRRLSREMQLGDAVEIQLQTPDQEPTWTIPRNRILFEDEDLIAIDKPNGLPSQATLDRRRSNLHRAVEIYLKKKGGSGYAGLHHRLDRDTSGVIILSKSRRANTGLARQFAERTALKTYVAWVQAPSDASAIQSGTTNEGQPWLHQDSWEIQNHLRKQPGRPSKMVVVKSGGDFAHTSFRVLKKTPQAWLIQAQLHTGRMHQIRVHLNGCGLPVLGDPIYGNNKSLKASKRLMLHAFELKMTHPITAEELTLQAPLPVDF